MEDLDLRRIFEGSQNCCLQPLQLQLALGILIATVWIPAQASQAVIDIHSLRLKIIMYPNEGQGFALSMLHQQTSTFLKLYASVHSQTVPVDRTSKTDSKRP